MSYAEEVAALRADQQLLVQSHRTLLKFMRSHARMLRENAAKQIQTDETVERLRVETEEIRRETERLHRQNEESDRLSKERMDRLELVLAEVGDKLNGLIGYMDGRQG